MARRDRSVFVADDPAVDAAVARANAEELCSAEEIESAIAGMAEKAAVVIGGRNPIVLSIMNGGLFTTVKLTSHFDFPYETDRIQVSRYGTELTGHQLTWLIEPALDCRDRLVLLVDDILDQGVTLDAVKHKLISEGASDVLSAVLVVKDTARTTPVSVDFSGLHCPDRYVFGCGMDYRGFWRGLPALYALAED